MNAITSSQPPFWPPHPASVQCGSKFLKGLSIVPTVPLHELHDQLCFVLSLLGRLEPHLSRATAAAGFHHPSSYLPNFSFQEKDQNRRCVPPCAWRSAITCPAQRPSRSCHFLYQMDTALLFLERLA